MMRRKRLGLLIFFILPFALLTVSCDNDSEKESGNSPVAKLKVTTENKNSAEIVVNKSTNKELNFTIKMPELSFNEIKTEQYGTFSKINENGFSLTDGGEENFSYPQTPVIKTYIAVPYGEEGDAGIQITPLDKNTKKNIRLFPIQKPIYDVADAKDTTKFEFNEAIYNRINIKSGIASWKPSFNKSSVTRDYNVFELTINLADYYSEKQTIVTYKSFDVKLIFKGDVRYFSLKRKNINPDIPEMDDVDQWFENSNELSIESVLNTSIMVSPELSIYEKFKPYNLGARFIIVSDPNFLEAANRLRIHKNSRGIRTIVASTEVIGDTVNDIKTYLENAYNNWLVRPKWVLLLGDAEFIPTHYGTINSYDNIENAGDMFYGQFSDDATEIPVFGIGRIPVDTEEQAMDVVEKIINFETNPPTSFLLAGNPFYHTLTLAAQFQDCDNGHPVPDGQAVRKFAETTENIRDYIVGTGKMKANRIYAADNQNISPKYWSNGIEIPGYLQKPTFAWDGDRQDIIDAVNEGTSLLYHRDHGWWDSWGTPGFSFNDIADIHVNDNKYPVVYSINCASGIFDNETCDPFYNLQGWWYIHPNAVYWSEEFLRKPDGALAIIGDTRASSSNLNNDIAKGLFDATWPGYLTYGSDTVIRKLGDILNHAKGYLKSRGHDQSSLKQELLIYNLLGDPTIELKSKKAWKISIEKILFLEKGIEVNIRIPEAEPSLGVGPIFAIAKVKDRKLGERVIGRAILIHSDNSEDSIINIKLQENVNPEDITLTLSGNEIYTVQRAISK